MGESLSQLREEVLEANLEIARRELALYTWGNASGIDRAKGLVAIKPSGVAYEDLAAQKLVVLDLDGKVVEGDLAPSTDAASHLALYRAWPEIGGVCHTHSPGAVAWAQACREIPCLGTTHADHFYGRVPVTEPLTPDEIAGGYELATGESIVREFAKRELKPLEVPGALCANHGPFAWGVSAGKAVYHGAVLEECAKMAMWTFALSPEQPPISKALLGKHYLRKHGPGAYYGQGVDRP
ncbi:MAG: L-ribulose-5-phosphate 4-epimerase AraD [Planctomycetota bacterium]